LIAVGAPAKALSDFIDQSSITVTLDRDEHLFGGRRAEAASLLDTLLARADTVSRVQRLV